ncbi:unnamed protein product [Sphagnum balticum]
MEQVPHGMNLDIIRNQKKVFKEEDEPLFIPRLTMQSDLYKVYTSNAGGSRQGARQSRNGNRIVYHEGYNLSFLGIEKCHPFDSQKYYNARKVYGAGSNQWGGQALANSRKLLLECLTRCFLFKLFYILPICKYIEMPLIVFPSFLLRWRVLNPMLLATEGTVLSALIAVEKGWVVNLSGGYHHANIYSGSGFCIYPDITICVHLPTHPVEYKEDTHR